MLCTFILMHFFYSVVYMHESMICDTKIKEQLNFDIPKSVRLALYCIISNLCYIKIQPFKQSIVANLFILFFFSLWFFYICATGDTRKSKLKGCLEDEKQQNPKQAPPPRPLSQSGGGQFPRTAWIKIQDDNSLVFPAENNGAHVDFVRSLLTLVHGMAHYDCSLTQETQWQLYQTTASMAWNTRSKKKRKECAQGDDVHWSMDVASWPLVTHPLPLV